MSANRLCAAKPIFSSIQSLAFFCHATPSPFQWTRPSSSNELGSFACGGTNWSSVESLLCEFHEHGQVLSVHLGSLVIKLDFSARHSRALAGPGKSKR